MRREEHHFGSGVFGGREKRFSGPFVSDRAQYGRVAAEPGGVQRTGLLMGPAFSRLLRVKNKHPAPEVCVLERGRKSYLHRRIKAFKGKGERFRASARCDHSQGASGSLHVVKGSYSGGARVAVSGLVADDTTYDDRGASVVAGQGRSAVSRPRSGRLRSAPMEVTLLSDLREQLKTKGFSAEVTQALLGRWERSTVDNYSLAWRKWAVFCGDRKIDRFDPPESGPVEFLGELFTQTGSASSVNTAISALSAVLKVSLGCTLAEWPMVSEFRAAVNKKTPPGPTYRTTWDITVLLRKVETFGENESMALELLLLKVVALLRIDCFARSSDITRIFREDVIFQNDRVVLHFLRTKEWRAASQNAWGEFSAPVSIFKLKAGVSTCCYQALAVWMKRTEAIVRSQKVHGRWRTPVVCHVQGGFMGKPVSAKYVATLSYAAMRAAGVDPSFKGRTIRAAASSAAKDYGASEKEVVRQGRWTDGKMWRKYYYRSIPRVVKKTGGTLQQRIRAGLN